VMPEGKRMSITKIVLRPRIVVAAGTKLDRVRRLVDLAHEQCFIASSLKSEIVVEAAIEQRDD
jgi:organic hydroperoxide reductase OsmC/OhrA